MLTTKIRIHTHRELNVVLVPRIGVVRLDLVGLSVQYLCRSHEIMEEGREKGRFPLPIYVCPFFLLHLIDAIGSMIIHEIHLFSGK